jgi:type II secretory pathway pseudopilin PulG
MRIGLLIVAGLALIGFLVVAVVLPQMQGTQAKEAAEALVAGAQPAQQQVSAVAEKAGSLSGAGRGVKVASKNDPQHGELKWIVADDGSIRGWNEKNALEVALIPSVQSGKVSWNCRGYPVSAMPSSCGGR